MTVTKSTKPADYVKPWPPPRSRPTLGEDVESVVQFSAKIPLRLMETLNEIRKTKGWSLQRLIREALVEFVNRHQHPPRGPE